MARADVTELYQELLDSNFDFMPRGSNHIDDVYRQVKSKFGNLCDDTFLCSENCGSGHEQPEWKHAVRKALDRLKRVSGSVQKTSRKYYWNFR